MTLPFADDLIKGRDGDRSNLLTGMKAVSGVLQGTDQTSYIDSRIDALVHHIRVSLPTVVGIQQVFREWKFEEPSADEFHEYKHSDVTSVFMIKKGLRITYAAIILEVCQQLDIDGFGINFPGMFLAKVGDTVVDPIGCTPIRYDRLRDQLRKMQYFVKDEPDEATNEEILARVFQNLLSAAERQEDLLSGLKFIDYLKILSPDDWSPYFKEAQFRGSMGDLPGARLALKMTRNRQSDPQILKFLDTFERDLESNVSDQPLNN